MLYEHLTELEQDHRLNDILEYDDPNDETNGEDDEDYKIDYAEIALGTL